MICSLKLHWKFPCREDYLEIFLDHLKPFFTLWFWFFDVFKESRKGALAWKANPKNEHFLPTDTHTHERLVTLLKRDSNTGVPMKFAKFLRTPILKNICERLLLYFIKLASIHSVKFSILYTKFLTPSLAQALQPSSFSTERRNVLAQICLYVNAYLRYVVKLSHFHGYC